MPAHLSTKGRRKENRGGVFPEREDSFRGDGPWTWVSWSSLPLNFCTKATGCAAPEASLPCLWKCCLSIWNALLPPHPVGCLSNSSTEASPFHQVPEYSVLKNVFLVWLKRGEAKAFLTGVAKPGCPLSWKVLK